MLYHKILSRIYHKFFPLEVILPEASDEELRLIKSVMPYTMTSPERLYAMLKALEYIAPLDGDIVECGVWRGGTMMLAAKYLRQKGLSNNLYLYDTFTGMTRPSDKDTSKFSGDPLASYLLGNWCAASVSEVDHNMYKTGYPFYQLVAGNVLDTLPNMHHDKIALLRLDTDFYDSTMHELIHLFPLLVEGGVLILDDYGHWDGQRLAVTEYFKKNNIHMLLNRIDYTGRIGIKHS